MQLARLLNRICCPTQIVVSWFACSRKNSRHGVRFLPKRLAFCGLPQYHLIRNRKSFPAAGRPILFGISVVTFVVILQTQANAILALDVFANILTRTGEAAKR